MELREDIAKERHAANMDVLQRLSPTELLTAALKQLYGTSENLESLLYAITPERGIFKDVDVSFVLSNIKDAPDECMVDMRYSATATGFTEYVAAFVLDSKVAAHLVATCPKLVNVWSFVDMVALNAAVTFAKTVRGAFQYMVSNETGNFGPLHSTTLEEVPMEEYTRYDVPSVGPDGQTIILLRKFISRYTDREAVLITRMQSRMSKYERYCYYWEDRPSYVRRVAFDWSRLSYPVRQKPKYFLVPFFLPKGPLPIIPDDATRIEVPVEQWIVRGQGLLLLW